MKLAIIHYHFRRGGVTQVALNHLRGFASLENPPDKVLLIEGEDSQLDLDEAYPFPCERLCVPGLGYDQRPLDLGVPLADSLIAAIQQAGGRPSDTVLHIHNHSLGKNVSMPTLVRELAGRGWPLVLQIHDFAEDYRPKNYLNLIQSSRLQSPVELDRWLYPQADNIHYATLTQRDYRLLRDLGIAETDVSVFPNPVVSSTDRLPDHAEAKAAACQQLQIPVSDRLGVYPVRGIRRKNLGEMLLWAAVCPQTQMMVTQRPTSSIELTTYQMWMGLARAKELRAHFDVGMIDQLSFDTIRGAADFMFTSSVAEGFGMVFLESWLAEKNLMGRDLPAVTEDFRQNEIAFPSLADSINIPVDMVGVGVEGQIWEAYCSAWQSLPDGFIDHLNLDQTQPVASQDTVDFARLPVGIQAQVVAAAAADAGVRAEIMKHNAIMRIDQAGDTESLVSENRRRVVDRYSPKPLAESMMRVYQNLLWHEASGEISSPENPGSLVQQLARYDTFTPCRTLEI